MLGRDGNGQTNVEITYRFGPPDAPSDEDGVAAGDQNSLDFFALIFPSCADSSVSYCVQQVKST